jgi:hypothetical protein
MKRKTFKKLRAYKYAAKLNISAGSGRIIQDESHIDFWIYDTFQPDKAVVSVEPLPHA